jgi:hypothetical protein
MNKDALLATAIGFVIGLAITGLLLVGPSIMQKFPKFSFQMPTLPKAQPKQPTPTGKQEIKELTIDSPIAESIEHEKELLVTGKAMPGSIIVLQGVSGEIAVTTNDDGAYAAKVTLVEGKNDVIVTATAKDYTSSKILTVFYTPEAL